DTIRLDQGRLGILTPSYVWAGSGNDRIYGAQDNCWIDGGGGDDQVHLGSGEHNFNARNWAPNGTSMDGVAQTQSYSCAVLAWLASVARNHTYHGGTVDLKDGIRYIRRDGDGALYGVTLFDGTQWREYQVHFDGKTAATDPRSAHAGEFWTILFQRAYSA